MMELRELYQETILDHNREPRNHYAMSEPTCQAQGFNPLCGDKLTVYVKIEEGILCEVSFVGRGCAISQAAASLMTEALHGKTIAEARTLFQQFHSMLTSEGEDAPLSLNKLLVFSGVRAFPARVKCATLAWRTLEAALENKTTAVSTE